MKFQQNLQNYVLPGSDFGTEDKRSIEETATVGCLVFQEEKFCSRFWFIGRGYVRVAGILPLNEELFIGSTAGELKIFF